MKRQISKHYNDMVMKHNAHSITKLVSHDILFVKLFIRLRKSLGFCRKLIFVFIDDVNR